MTFEEINFDLHCALTEKLNEFEAEVKGVRSPPEDAFGLTQTNMCTQFPQVPIPTYSGKVIDWPSFYDSFNKLIHLNESLTYTQKFHYLKKALPLDHDTDIQNMLMTEINYKTAWKLLQNRYNNPRILFAHHMNALYQLPVLTKENAEAIKTMLNTANVCISEFKRLQLPISTCDHWIAHFLSTKLSNETNKAWETHLGCKTHIPTFSDFQEFLQNRLFVLDVIESRSSHLQSKNTVVSHNQKPSSSNNHPKSHKTHTFHMQSGQSQLNCFLCQQSHILRRCPTFLSKDSYERKSIVDQKKLCLNCLSNNHSLAQCSSNKNCYQCGQRHHTLLHFPNTSRNASRTDANTPQQVTTAHIELSSNSIVTNSSQTSKKPTVLLATAMVKLVNPLTKTTGTFCALIDQGSEGTIISSRAVQQLNLPKTKTFVNICGINSTVMQTAKSTVSCLVSSHFDSDFAGTITNAYVLDRINIVLPSNTIPTHTWPHLEGLNLADPLYHQQKRIDILLGADVYSQILLSEIRRGKSNQPLAQNTYLGWILSGPATSDDVRTPTIHCNFNLMELEAQINRFYESEQIPEIYTTTTEDEWCENFFRTTHIRQTNGKYLVKLPLKTHFDTTQVLGKSRQMSLNRYLHLERRLNQKTELKRQYSEAIQDYFDQNQIIPAKCTEDQTLQWTSSQKPYIRSAVLPHHAVIKEDSLTTKMRIVFDASMKTSNGKSLNDILCIGPKLQNDLSAILLNWRLHKFVFSADIRQMYRCIDMDEEDSQFQRILWRDPATGIVKDYCLTTVTFGTASAPYTAIRVLHQIAEDEQHNFPLSTRVLKEDTYVDDVLSGGDTLENTIKSQTQLIGALQRAGMELRKWASNHPSILTSIPKEHQSCNPDIMLNSKDSVKTLGLLWHPQPDFLTFHLPIENVRTVTKRTVLSNVARIFDPLGLITPITITSKIILKELWLTRVARTNSISSPLTWDEEIPATLRAKWQQFRQGLLELTNVKVGRWLNTSPSHNKSIQLHVFCDGSTHAYAAAIYLRVETWDNEVLVHLLSAKSRVTPTKPLTIPRIELCGATLAVDLAKWTQRHLRGVDSTTPTFYWTDATIVLYWIYGDINRWKTYVANRVQKILNYTNPSQWHHIRTLDNPADCATRGLTPSQLKTFDLWWKGPKWLVELESTWPKLLAEITSEVDREEKPPLIRTYHQTNADSIILRYSNLKRLLRVTATLFRFYLNCKQKDPILRHVGELTHLENENSLLITVRQVQRHAFADAIHCIRTGKALPTNSKLRSLTPFLDSNDILRLRGRLEHSSLSYSQKHPMLLPADHHFTNLVIEDAHHKCLHGGTQLTLTVIRLQFWIINARRAVKSRIHKCITCFRNRPKPVTQLMGDLPLNRINPPSRPFISVGIDFTGPIELKASKYRGHSVYKGYIAIFICLATKAVHIEAVTGLTTEDFLAALHRFVGRRGMPRDIYSDCGTNFIGAASFLQANELEFKDHIMTRLAQDRIRWHFNPPYSPNFGGLWEANIKSIKHHLKRVITGIRLTFENLNTVLIKIEACLNSRPLCPLTSDPEDLLVLTPAHFLIGDSMLALPERENIPKGITKYYLERQQMLKNFWNRWSTDWLSHLQQRPKWRSVEPNLNIGELVLIKDDRLPPTNWTLGRILETCPGTDGLVRVVMVKTRGGTYKRSISKICRLPLP